MSNSDLQALIEQTKAGSICWSRGPFGYTCCLRGAMISIDAIYLGRTYRYLKVNGVTVASSTPGQEDRQAELVRDIYGAALDQTVSGAESDLAVALETKGRVT